MRRDSYGGFGGLGVSGGSMIGTKEGLNKEDLGLKLKIKDEFTLSHSN